MIGYLLCKNVYHVFCCFVFTRVFGHFEKPLFLELCKHMECKLVPAGGSLFKIGDEDNCIYVVQSGKINVFITEGVTGLSLQFL